MTGATASRTAAGTTASFVRSCLSSPLNALFTLAVLAGLVATIPPLFEWAVLDAVWSGASGRDCSGKNGACWIFIHERFGQIVYGSYPLDQRWRADLTAGLGALVIAALVWSSLGRRLTSAGILITGYAVVGAILLRGGVFGLVPVPTGVWGGLMLTLVVAAWTIATALPLGLVLALARRSRMPVVAHLAAGFIDVVRGLPLVGILFLAVILFPLFAPPGVESDKLMRALLAFTLFNAANLAEVFRGGLQSVASGQEEAGASLGLSEVKVTWLVVVPQAVAISIPAVVNVCIAIVKETTIVLLVGLFDFLGVLQAGVADPEWLMADQARETAYLFAALVFFFVCFGLSRYSLHLERRLSVSKHR
jgi:general L-amino acid transport system permease protein